MHWARTTTTTLNLVLLTCAVVTGACSLGGPPSQVTAERQRMPVEVAADAGSANAAASSRAEALLGKLPPYFIENRGQEDPRVAYYLQGRDIAIYFTSTGVTFALSEPDGGASAGGHPAEGDAESNDRGVSVHRASLSETAQRSGLPRGSFGLPARERWIVRLDFVGARPVAPQGEASPPATISYWRDGGAASQTGLPTYGRVVYRDLWPGIDLAYAGTASQLKYTFLVKPGADPEQIRLAYRGAMAVTLTEGGQLAIATPTAGFTDDRPYAYQEDDSGRDNVEAAFAMVGAADDCAQVYGFKLGRYDHSRTLVLDPSVLVYAGYIAGSEKDFASAIALDAAGNAYVTGLTLSNVGAAGAPASTTRFDLSKENCAATSGTLQVTRSGFDLQTTDIRARGADWPRVR